MKFSRLTGILYRFIFLFVIFFVPRSGVVTHIDTPDWHLNVYLQPIGNPLYVYSGNKDATQLVSQTLGAVVVGAHNTLGGRFFSDLSVGETFAVSFLGGHRRTYVVSEVYRFRVVPSEWGSLFIDVETKNKYSAIEIISRFFSGNKVVLITCITLDDPYLGRMFVIAEPLTE